MDAPEHFLNLSEDLLAALEEDERTGQAPSVDTIERLEYELARRMQAARYWRDQRAAAGELIEPEEPTRPLGL